MARTIKAWKPGQVVAGRYRLIAELGRGGMGSVWRAHDRSIGAEIAIKRLHGARLLERDALRRFRREAETAAVLRSPHVVQVFDHGLDGGSPYIVMELLEGESLATKLSRLGRLSMRQTAEIVTQLARAVDRAHAAGIVHRDLKPANVFLVRNSEEEVVKVLDFGVAKVLHGALDSTQETQTGTPVGTPSYMSPEQARGSEVGPSTDLWSIGIIAFECLTGAPPFAGKTFGELVLKLCTEAAPVPSRVTQVPTGFDDWFIRAAQRMPQDRFKSAKAMADGLRHLAQLPEMTDRDESPPAQPHTADQSTFDPRSAGPPTATGDEQRSMEPSMLSVAGAPRFRTRALGSLAVLVGAVLALAFFLAGGQRKSLEAAQRTPAMSAETMGVPVAAATEPSATGAIAGADLHPPGVDGTYDGGAVLATKVDAGSGRASRSARLPAIHPSSVPPPPPRIAPDASAVVDPLAF